jgi:hypothetical protein
MLVWTEGSQAGLLREYLNLQLLASNLLFLVTFLD